MTVLRSIARRLASAADRFSNNDDLLAAAGISYYVALSFFPLLLVLLAGLGYVFQWTEAGQDAQQQLLSVIEQQVSPGLGMQVQNALRAVSDRASIGGPIGFLVLIITTLTIFAQIDYAFDRVWGVTSDPNQGWLGWIGQLFVVRLKALAMLIGVGVFVMAVMIASMVWSGVQAQLEPSAQLPPGARWLVGLGLNVGFNFVAFTLIYRALPKPRIYWTEALQGGIVASLLWEIGRQALAAYLLRLDYPTAYGLIGSFIAIMLWTNYAMIVLLFGAQYVRTVHAERAGRDALPQV